MSTPNEPPQSRRAARLAEQASQDAPAGAFAQPPTRRSERRTGSEPAAAPASAPISVPSSAPTEMSYRTQVRPRLPHYDAPPAERSQPAEPPPLVPPPAAPAAPPAYGATQMRRRDFRPPAPVEQRDAGFDTPLVYHTQRSTGPATSSVPETTPPPAPAGPHVIPEQALSRRELRALHQPEPEGSLEAALAPVAPPAPPVVPAAVPAAPPPPPIAPAAAPVPPPLAEPEIPVEPAEAPSPLRPEPTTGSHWSVGIHDDEDPFENTFSREVGSTASISNTNALVLPEMPTGSIAGPVSGTGEIIITGMIALPRAVSATGAVPAVHDSPELDDVYEPGELEMAPPDAAPVSALKAVSSHTGTHAVMTGKRPGGNTVTTVLVASTVVMAVVAIGLFVIAAINGLF